MDKFAFYCNLTFFDDSNFNFIVYASDMHQAYHEAVKYLLSLHLDISESDHLDISLMPRAS